MLSDGDDTKTASAKTASAKPANAIRRLYSRADPRRAVEVIQILPNRFFYDGKQSRPLRGFLAFLLASFSLVAIAYNSIFACRSLPSCLAANGFKAAAIDLLFA